jgi:enoyl-CoA hydratase/carnithine racemase
MTIDSEVTPFINAHKSNFVLDIEISRRDKKNALTSGMYERISQLLKGAQTDPQVNVVFLHGQEDLFTSGNDLREFLSLDLRNGSAALDFLKAISSFTKPLIAAVGGDAIGVGTTLLLHCDLVIASNEARFQMPFVNLGFCPEGGSSFILPQTGGTKLANELLMLGEVFSAETALKAGIINTIYPKNDLLNQGLELSRKLANKPQDALRTTKSLIKCNQKEQINQVLQTEFEQVVRLLQTATAKEIMTAFMEKRPPNVALFNHIESEKN